MPGEETCWRVFSKESGQQEPWGFHSRRGIWLKGLLSPPHGPTKFEDQAYLRESLACPSALARQPHPGSTFGFIRGTCHKAGSGRGAGSRGLTYLLPRLAGSALWSWRALQEAKHSKVGRVLGRPLQGKGTRAPMGETRNHRITASTPPPACWWETKAQQREWIAIVTGCSGWKTKDLELLMETGAASALRVPGGVWESQ